MIWLQISAGRGPVECERLVALLVKEIIADCEGRGIACECIECEKGSRPETCKSALLSVEAEIRSLETWLGVIQWIAPSAYRPNHKRKNWFAGIWAMEPPRVDELQESEVRFETTRAGGPGGQHVNTTDSAVRAIHLATGIVAQAQEERSQHRNRQLALARLKAELDELGRSKEKNARQRLWSNHNQLERGNPIRVYEGAKFRRKK